MHSDPLLSFLRDPRLASPAVSAAPAWLWTADGTRVLGANAAGAAVLGAANPHALAERRMSAAHSLASQVVRLAGTLPHGDASRLARPRGGGARGVGPQVRGRVLALRPRDGDAGDLDCGERDGRAGTAARPTGRAPVRRI